MSFSRMGRFPLSYMLAEKLVLTVLGVGASLILRAILKPMLAKQQPMTSVVATCVAATYVLAMLWTAAFNLLELPISDAFLGRHGSINSIGALLNGTVYNSFSLVAWGFLYLGLKHYVALQVERERALQAEKLLADVKLKALQYQLNPHLFFNTLNAISTLIVERRNDDAARMIARLGDFLRATLREDLAAQVPLAEELGFTAQYLDIEQVRFGDRLTVTYDIDEEAYRALVPLLLLQPLVENASRHGIARLEGPGTIAISARVTGGRLEIAIANSGPVHHSLNDDAAGIGLTNVRERLSVLYGDRQQLRAMNVPGGGYRVEMSLPFTPGARQPHRVRDEPLVLST